MSFVWSSSEVEVNGARLSYWRSGDGAVEGKRPIVLAHGFSDDGLCWLPLADELARMGYDVVMPDARGHGRSARVHHGQQIDATSDLAGTLQALGLVPAVVAGHSMGARTAAQLAARFPILVRALILEDPPWHAFEPGRIRGGVIGEQSPLGQWIRSLEGKEASQIVAEQRVAYPRWPEATLRRWCEAKLALDPEFLTVDDTGQMAWPDIVKAIKCPTLLFTADPDMGGIVTPELAQEIVAANPNIQVVHIEGVGHHIRFAAYDEYRNAVVAFLQALPL